MRIRKADPVRDLEHTRTAFDRAFGPGEEPRTFFSPGRVNLIGDHIDYSGGLVLPIALDRGTLLMARPRTDSRIRARSLDLPGEHIAHLADTRYRPEHDWFNYVLGVAHVAGQQGDRLPQGLDVLIAGDIPNGAGLSSSASVELAAAVAFRAFGRWDRTATELALIGQRAENEYVGVACGIMDQLAIATGKRGHALLMDCRRLTVQPIRFPHEDLALIVVNSHHRRTLADSAYNQRRAAVERAAATLGVERLVDAGDVSELAGAELEVARHTVTEQARVLAAADALRVHDYQLLGELMQRSHVSLRDDFGVTGAALDAVAEAAWAQPGVIGARMTGAGFGGCVVVIAEPGSEPEVIAGIERQVAARTGVRPEGMVISSDDGARELPDR
jgi:galactokinase